MGLIKKLIKAYFNKIYTDLELYADVDFHNIIGSLVTNAQIRIISDLQFRKEEAIYNYFNSNREILGLINNYSSKQLIRLFQRIPNCL